MVGGDSPTVMPGLSKHSLVFSKIPSVVTMLELLAMLHNHITTLATFCFLNNHHAHLQLRRGKNNGNIRAVIERGSTLDPKSYVNLALAAKEVTTIGKPFRFRAKSHKPTRYLWDQHSEHFCHKMCFTKQLTNLQPIKEHQKVSWAALQLLFFYTTTCWACSMLL